MTTAIWTLSLLSVAEFTFAPLNLWSGRTMPNFTRFTGLPRRLATRVFVPAKLATAATDARTARRSSEPEAPATASSTDATRKPFSPSRTTSGIEPRAQAVTGVPHAIASTT